MSRIEDIFELLDWNNGEEEQAEGVAQARRLDDFSALFQPLGKRFNKNVWDNCAQIVASKTDEQLAPFAARLFEWTADLNWPGAETILRRIKAIRSGGAFVFAALEAVRQAEAENDVTWKYVLSDLLESEFFAARLPKETRKRLESYRFLDLNAD